MIAMLLLPMGPHIKVTTEESSSCLKKATAFSPKASLFLLLWPLYEMGVPDERQVYVFSRHLYLSSLMKTNGIIKDVKNIELG